MLLYAILHCQKKKKTNWVASRTNAGDLTGVPVTTSPGRLEGWGVCQESLSPWHGKPTLQGGLFLACGVLPACGGKPPAESKGSGDGTRAQGTGRGEVGKKGNPDPGAGTNKDKVCVIVVVWLRAGSEGKH